VRDGLIPSNPMDRTDAPRVIHKEIDLPDVADVQSRIDALRGSSLYLPACIALLTGMRRSEIMGLMWDCVDLKQATIAVRRVRQRLTKRELAEMSFNQHTRRLALPGCEIQHLTCAQKTTKNRSFTPVLWRFLRTFIQLATTFSDLMWHGCGRKQQDHTFAY